MPFSRPTLIDIIERIKSDYKSGLQLKTIIRRSFLDVFAKAHGGASHTLHGHIEHGIKNKFFPDTGDEETVIRWGTLYNLPRKEATFAEIEINVTGTTGNTLSQNTVYQRDDGTTYQVKEDVIVPPSTTVQAVIVADVEGELSNLANGDEVELQSPVSGIDSISVVNTTLIEGENTEDIELYRERVLERLQFPPAGGQATDYIAFGKSVPGVTRVWVLPGHLGQGTVGLTFVEDEETPIIPDTAKVNEVQAAVLELQPIVADLFTFAPIELQLNPIIQLKPNTTAVQNAVIAELNDMLFREAEVRGALDPNQVGLGVTFDGKIPLSKINEAISIAEDEVDHVINFPTADVQPSVGGLVTLGTPVFITLP